jgi:hypothetical protein
MHITLNQLLIGLLMAGIGIAGVKYTFPIMNFTGSLDWIERYTGQGSTYLILKLFFLFTAIFGILYASGFGGSVIEFIFSPLKRVFQPGT